MREISLYQDTISGSIPESVESLIGGRMFGSRTMEWTNYVTAGRCEHVVLIGETQSGRKVRADEWENVDGVCCWSFETDFGSAGSASFALEVAEALALALPGEGMLSWVKTVSDMPLPGGRESAWEDGNHDFMPAIKLRDILLAQEEAAEDSHVEEAPRVTSQW